MMTNLQIVVVSTNMDYCDAHFKKNPNIRECDLVIFDNSVENIAITKRYNDFIAKRMKSDSWIVFCHQDFIFMESPSEKLALMDRSCIYGVIGTVLMKNPIATFLRKMIGFDNRRLFGQIFQGNGKGALFKHGNFLKFPKVVDTVDCCCIIVHGSLIEKYALQFDEKLDFHLYSEEFSMGSRLKYGIKTKAVQIKCRHLSQGDYKSGFLICADYLRSKYPGMNFSSTALNFS